MNLEEIRLQLRGFAEGRGWTSLHSPKNLVMALAAEAGELLQVLRWTSDEESRNLRHGDEAYCKVSEELADVAIYVIFLADALGLDLGEQISAKLDLLAQRFPQRGR